MVSMLNPSGYWAWGAKHTPGSNGASELGEGAEGADVLSGRGALHGCRDEARSTQDTGRKAGAPDGILGMVWVVVVVPSWSHGCEEVYRGR